MIYTLTRKSHSQLKVERIYKKFEFLPNEFLYKKWFPEGVKTYKKVISVQFRWLLWEFEILIRKPKT